MSDCPQCGAHFSCAQTGTASAPCWCMTLPPLPRTALRDSTCLCPACLHTLLAQVAATNSRATPDERNPA